MTKWSVFLSYHIDFFRNDSIAVLNSNEIHPISQARHIDLLGFTGNVALQQNLSCQVDDDVFGFRW